jgi:hypothetical protein
VNQYRQWTVSFKGLYLRILSMNGECASDGGIGHVPGVCLGRSRLDSPPANILFLITSVLSLTSVLSSTPTIMRASAIQLTIESRTPKACSASCAQVEWSGDPEPRHHAYGRTASAERSNNIIS